MQDTFFIGASLVNAQEIATPHTYLTMITTTVEDWFFAQKVDVPSLIAQGMSWIFLSVTLRIDEPVRAGEKLELEMCGCHRMGRIFRFDVRNRGDADRFSAAIFSTILDLQTRRICDLEKLETPLFSLDFGEILFEADSRVKNPPEGGEFVDTRKVMPSWTDAIGHVHNTRYAELAYDGMTKETRAELERLRKMEIFFLHELREGQSVNILRNTDSILGRKTDGTDAFVCRFTFADA